MVVMSHCTTHSFEIICCGWKVGLAYHIMPSFYKKHSYSIQCIIYISTISDILRQEVDFLAQWIRNPIRALGFFQTMHHFLVMNFLISPGCPPHPVGDNIDSCMRNTILNLHMYYPSL